MYTPRTVIDNVRRKTKDQMQRFYDESASNSGRSILLQYYHLPILQELPYLTNHPSKFLHAQWDHSGYVTASGDVCSSPNFSKFKFLGFFWRTYIHSNGHSAEYTIRRSRPVYFWTAFHANDQRNGFGDDDFLWAHLGDTHSDATTGNERF